MYEMDYVVKYGMSGRSRDDCHYIISSLVVITLLASSSFSGGKAER